MVLIEGYKIQFTPRVGKGEIRRIYEDDAKGIHDEKIIDEVGFLFYMRCLDIISVNDAGKGKVRCPYCWGKKGEANYILYEKTGYHEMQDLMLCCTKCGFTFAWADYVKAYRNNQLNSGGAMPAFQKYVREYPRCETAKEKMLLIDYLIHEFHYSLKSQPDLPTRSVGANLIEGKLSDIVCFLDELTYNTGSFAESAEKWKEKAMMYHDRYLEK